MKFVYVGGKTFSEHHSETTNDRGQVVGIDERRGVDMPDSTVVFGIKFIVGKPTEVLETDFPNREKYLHAVRKLEGNKFFKPFVEDAVVETVEPDKAPEPAKRGPGRPRLTVGVSEGGVG